MELELRETMKNLKGVTCELVDKLEQDDYDALENLIDKRQKLVNTLENIGCTKEQYSAAVKEFEIIHLQDKLWKMMNQKKSGLRKKINNISQKKVMTKSYNNRHLGGNIFSKKI
ncbi:MAG: hypothetical protein GXW91_02745 [Clostridiales bacterium]|nr:hypothetical protein [Clostridiales bacterium]